DDREECGKDVVARCRVGAAVDAARRALVVGAGRDRLPDGADRGRRVAAERPRPPGAGAHGPGEGRDLREGRRRRGDDAAEGHGAGRRQRRRPGPPHRGVQPSPAGAL
ncbi:MAG: hypothetical protein AVDCRST_MAG54-1732, partial [uncultured Actinomycetospora sp.]